MPGPSRRILAVPCLLCVILLAGCSSNDNPTEPEPGPDLTVASLTLSPTSASFAALGDTIRFSAEAFNAAGEVVPATVIWSATAPSIVAVDTAGLAESRGGGQAAIIATAEGFADTAAVTVTLRTLVWAAAVDGTWDDPGNWRGGVVPAASDTAVINAVGDYEVTLAGDTEVERLVLGGVGGTQRLVIGIGGLQMASFVMDGAELDAGGPVSVSDEMEWKGGAVTGTGTLTMAAGAVLRVGGGSPIPELETRLVNGGTVAVVSGSRLDIATSGVLINPVGSVIDFQSDGAILPYAGGSVISPGTIRKSAGVGVAAFGASSGNFVVNGRVEVQSGALRIAGGEVLGPVDIAPDARLEALGAITMAGDIAFPNTGAVDIDGSVTIGVDAGQTITIPYLTLHSGIVGGVANIAVTDSLVWVRGGIEGTGEIIVADGAIARLAGDDFSKSLAGRHLVVNGSLTAGSSLDFLLEDGASITVASTGRWDQGFAGQIRQGAGSGSTFQMDGIFTKMDAETTVIAIPLECTGQLLLDDGLLEVIGAFTLTETSYLRGGGPEEHPGNNLRLDLTQASPAVLGGTIEVDHGGQAAQLDIAGEATMTANTVVRIDLAEAGDIRGERLIFSESVAMAGTLEITRTLVPEAEDNFVVVSIVHGTGQFATITGAEGFDITQDGNGVRLYWPPPPR